MFVVTKYFETVTDSGIHIGLREGDILHQIDEEKYQLDGTGHTFKVFSDCIEERTNKESSILDKAKMSNWLMNKKEKALEHKPEKSDTQAFVLGMVIIMDELLKEIYRGTFDK